MRYLKYFESQTEVSLKEKLETIVDMCEYLWLIDNVARYLSVAYNIIKAGKEVLKCRISLI